MQKWPASKAIDFCQYASNQRLTVIMILSRQRLNLPDIFSIIVLCPRSALCDLQTLGVPPLASEFLPLLVDRQSHRGHMNVLKL